MDIARQSLAITLVFALLWAALWLLRRKGAIRFNTRRSRSDGAIESRARLSLTAQHSIHLVRVGKREFVLASHPSGVTLLAELPSQPGGEP